MALPPSKYLRCLAILAIGLLPVVVRPGIEAKIAFARGQEEMLQGDIRGAIESFRQTLIWRTLDQEQFLLAKNALLEISSNQALPIELRSLALENLKSGARTSRSFAYPELYEDVSSTAGQSRAAIDALHPELKDRDTLSDRSQRDPQYHWQALSNLAFALWIALTVLAIWKAFDSNGKVSMKRLIPWMAASGSVYAMWLVMLSRS